MEYKQLADEAILLLIAERDMHALEEIYDRHSQTVYNVIVRIVREPSIAESILQETFWQVWKKAGDFEGTGVAAAWIYRIARNKSLDQLRRQKARPQPSPQPVEEHYDLSEPSPDGALTTVEVHVERQRHRTQLQEALNSIPAEQRLCLELAYFEGMSHSQIAEYTETPLGTIKTRVRMGLQKMERILRASGYQKQDL